MRIAGGAGNPEHGDVKGDLMRQLLILLVAGAALSACASDGRQVSGAGADAAFNGEIAYLEHCAVCHDDGMFGAPRVGAPQDWQSRSNLWQAVLMEHAKQGYFDMPARGGKSDLSDELVSAASEYMLEQTFPERPED